MIPPTGRRISGPYVGITVVEDGLIVSDKLYHDRLHLLEELGLVPEPASSS